MPGDKSIGRLAYGRKARKGGNKIMYILYETCNDGGGPGRDPLTAWGWDKYFTTALATLGARAELEPARVIETRRGSFLVIRKDREGSLREREAVLSGKLMHETEDSSELPATGDWLAVRGGENSDGTLVVEAVLPRKTTFARKATGDTAHDRVERQVLAANIDTAFIVAAAGNDFNVRRIERYAALTWESGAQPVVLITKSDIAGDSVAELVLEAELACPGVPVYAICAPENQGLEQLERHLCPGSTVIMLGSSGSGKSTLLNALAGKVLRETGEVKEYDQRGRHTTTSRTLFKLESGALVIDTPGLREVQLWVSEDSIDSVFSEFDEAARNCKFSDCAHGSEPGCAVQAALQNGDITQERYDSWMKLKREAEFTATRTDPLARQAQKAIMKRRNKMIKKRNEAGKKQNATRATTLFR